MPDLVPKILTGVMGEFWDDVPGPRHARRTGWRWTVCGHSACLRPGLSAMRRKPRQAVQQLARGHSWCSLEALAVLRGLGRGACGNLQRSEEAFQPASSP
jgi:hypothetical protein